MDSPEITEAFSSFELAVRPHCDAYDWDAWPLIRCWLALTQVQANGACSHDRPAMMSMVPWGTRSILRAPVWALKSRGMGLAGVPAEQVAIITRENRAQLLDGRYYRYLADPAARMLASAGVTSAVWQRDRPVRPAWHHAFFAEAPLFVGAAARRLSGRTKRIAKAPSWFTDIADWHGGVFGSALPWHVVSWVLVSAESIRQTYASWFKRAGTRLVLTDTWYGVPGMAAILAARGLGIPALDLQHGLQGAGHIAYSGWHGNTYTTDMCAFPSGFWVWGARDADCLIGNNPGVVSHDCVFAAGNPWLNEWLDPSEEALHQADTSAAQLTDGWAKVVLVTLQFRAQIDEVFDLVNRTPDDWLWLVRSHRKWRDTGDEVEARAKARGLSRVVSGQATELPLYALMRRADVHVTWWSTCALEATAFGVPTVLLHRVGEDLYGDYLRAGVMKLALQQDDAARAIAAASRSAKDDWRAVPEAFSGSAHAQKELERMLSTHGLLPSRTP